jgi:hypothetical protein
VETEADFATLWTTSRPERVGESRDDGNDPHQDEGREKAHAQGQDRANTSPLCRSLGVGSQRPAPIESKMREDVGQRSS